MSKKIKIIVPSDMSVQQFADEFQIDIAYFNNLTMYGDVDKGQEFEIPIDRFGDSDLLPEMSPILPAPALVLKEVIIVAPPLDTHSAYSSLDQLYEYVWQESGNPAQYYDQELINQAIIHSALEYLPSTITDTAYSDTDRSLLPGGMLSEAVAISLLSEDELWALGKGQNELYQELVKKYGIGQLLQTYIEARRLLPDDLLTYATEVDEFYQFALAYQYLFDTEQGLDSPYTPVFQPDYATDTLLFSEFLFDEIKDFSDDEIQSTLMRMMTGNMVQLQGLLPSTTDPLSPFDIEEQLYQLLETMYGPDYTAEDVANFVSDLSYQYLASPDSLLPVSDSMQTTLGASTAFLQGRRIDEARQIVNEWDQAEAELLLGSLRQHVQAIQNLPDNIFDVSLSEVKAAFSHMLKSSEANYSQIIWFKNEAPTIEQQLFDTNQDTDERLAMRDNFVFTAMGIIASTVSEPVDWALSLHEAIVTGSIEPLIWSFFPGISGLAAASLGRLLKNSHLLQYGDDAVEYIDEYIKFVQRFRGNFPNLPLENRTLVYQLYNAMEDVDPTVLNILADMELEELIRLQNAADYSKQADEIYDAIRFEGVFDNRNPPITVAVTRNHEGMLVISISGEGGKLHTLDQNNEIYKFLQREYPDAIVIDNPTRTIDGNEISIPRYVSPDKRDLWTKDLGLEGGVAHAEPLMVYSLGENTSSLTAIGISNRYICSRCVPFFEANQRGREILGIPGITVAYYVDGKLVIFPNLTQ